MAKNTENLKSTFYFIRHAENIGVADKFSYEPNKDILTEYGKKQAELFGELLKDEKFTMCFTSDFRSCTETVDVFFGKNKHEKISVNFDNDIRDMNLGKYYNVSMLESMKSVCSSFEGDVAEWNLGGADDMKSINKRAIHFIQKLLTDLDQRGRPQTILVVTHSIIIHFIMKYLQNSENVLNWDPKCLLFHPNASYTKLTVGGSASSSEGTSVKRNVFFEKIAETGHLPEGNTDPLVEFAKSAYGKQFDHCIQT